jgi:hypothetical protein
MHRACSHETSSKDDMIIHLNKQHSYLVIKKINHKRRINYFIIIILNKTKLRLRIKKIWIIILDFHSNVNIVKKNVVKS